MSDRLNYFYRQLVAEDELDQGFADLEQADWSFATDFSRFGIITGGVASEHSPQNMTIDLTGPCIGYEQLGKRCYFGPVQNIDCSHDKDGNPTAVSSPGNHKYLSVILRFARNNTDPRTDGNGNTVYFNSDESFVVEVEQFAESGSPSLPTPPSDGLLICNVQLHYGDTTIANADIDTTNRHDFEDHDADITPVDSSGWSNIDNTVETVQTALDSVDNELISRDGSGDIDQDLISDGSSRDLGSSGQPWDVEYINTLRAVTAIYAQSLGLPLGDVTNRFDLYARDISFSGQIVPSATGKDVGTASARVDVFGEDITVYNSILASATGKALGAAGARFAAFLDSITHYGALKGTLQFNAAKSITVRINPSHALSTGNWSWNGTYWGNSTTTQSLYWYLPVLEDVVLDQVRIRWYQATSTTLSAVLESLDEDNAPTTIVGPTTIGGAGANRWDAIGSSLAETIDLTTKTYRARVITSGTEDQRAYLLEATYNITDILAAALGRC